MRLVVQPHVISIIMVSIVLIILMVLANRALRSFDPLAKPTGLVLLSLIAVDTVDRLVLSDTNKKVAKNLGPYVGTLWGYLFLSCIWGLTGFDAPTGNYSVTLTMAIMTIFLVEYYSIKSNGIKNYIHGLFEPIFVFLPMNLVGKLSPIVSLSMRMFANILSGSLIMSLVYTATAWVSSLFPVIGSFNFIGVIIAPILHTYFDLISGLLQTFIFTSLTIIFIGKELPSD
ncbi:MAG: F0F1 ATP synthase subunit A [Erysipelotrichaceae bacterium]|nr:F0F1 ATP synthase subunit A [Erysipelotrichaceae bacterium]